MQSYIAFISYRHQPVDQAVARKLHRLIEHFHVPKELRRDGSKRLGRVFRDEDELPLSTDLGESIRYALDHSEYLIAVCTPEYQKSRWCMEELNAFIASHGRDHVLAVLAAGAPEESFPPQLLTDTDTEGNVRAVEPLAANIAAPTNAKRMKRLKTEHLRLAAAMLGCSYDSLYQRERRYRQRRIIAASAAALAVAGVFIGTLISKNAQIQARYEESQANFLQAQANLRLAQYNESVSLTENARMDLALGRRSDAVRTLLKAIPDAGDQPYDRSAEGELISALGVYGDDDLRFISNIRQSADIREWEVSGDGSIVYTLDEFSAVRAWSAETGSLIWQASLPFDISYGDSMIRCDDPRGVICMGSSGEIVLLSAETGRELWRESTETGTRRLFLREKAGEAICLIIPYFQNQLLIRHIDLATGALLQEQDSAISPAWYSGIDNIVLSADGRFAAALVSSSDNSNDMLTGILADLETGSVREYPLVSGTFFSVSAALAFLPDGTLLVSAGSEEDGLLTLTLQKIQPESGETVYSTSLQSEVHSITRPVHMLACTSEYAMLIYNRTAYEFSVSDGKPLQQAPMPGTVLSLAAAFPDEYPDTFLCAFDNGQATYLVHVTPMSDMDRYNLECGFSLSKAQIEPDARTLSLVPRNRSNELLLVRRAASPAAVPESISLTGNARLSPSGEKILMQDSSFASFAVLSTADDGILLDQRIDNAAFLPVDRSIWFSADEKTLYCDKYAIRIDDGTVSELTIPDGVIRRTAVSFVPAVGKAVTAALSLEYLPIDPDGSMSAEEYQQAIKEFLNDSSKYHVPYFHIFAEGEDLGRIALPEGAAISGNVQESGVFRLDECGLLLISGDPDSALLAYDTVSGAWRVWNAEGAVAQASSGNRNQISALVSGNTLCLTDFESGSILWKAETGISPELVTGLWFSPDDRLLLMTYGKTRAAVYRVSDGTLLNDVPLITYTDHCVLSMQQDTSGLLYVYNARYGYTVSSSGDDSLILDGATGELLGRIPRLTFVNFRTGKVYRYNKYSGYAQIYPMYSREKLLELAEPFR